MASTDGDNPADGEQTDVTEEVRLSVVLYGGVSLAIYISGVCLELLNLVRATSAVARATETLDMRSSSRAYRAAAALTPSMLRDGGDELDDVLSAPDPIDRLVEMPMRRRFIVDVLSGSSAGGLNAAYLAKALVENRSMDPIKDVWVQEGDINRLLNDAEINRHLDEENREQLKVPERELPTSLLSGDRFYLLLREALRELAETGAGNPKPLVEALDCFLTTTDLRGIPVPIELNDGETASELRHRAVGRLIFGTTASTGGDRNDFQAEHDPFIAFLCRATAAHPAAFHPAQMAQIAALDNTDLERRDTWAKLLTPSPEGEVWDRWYSDGGDIDNKPFGYALDPIKARRASVPVDRKVIYVEPSPGEAGTEWKETSLPSLFSYTAGAALLGRKENIRDDIEEIKALNRKVRDLRRVLDDVVESAVHPRAGDVWTQPRDEASRRWIDATPEGQHPDEVARLVYEKRRAREVVAELADLVVDLAEVPTRSPKQLAFRRAVTEHLDTQYKLDQADDANEDSDHRRLLVDFDVNYRLRRLGFLDQILSQYQRSLHAPAATEGLWSELHTAEDVDDTGARVRRLRQDLNHHFIFLRAFRRAIHHSDGQDERTVLGDWPEPGTDFRDTIRGTLAPFIGQLRDGSDDGLPDGFEIKEFFKTLRALYEEVLADSSAQCRALLGAVEPDPLADRLKALWSNFDEFDIHLLPSWDEIRGEVDEVQVVRVSPIDARSIIDSAEQPDRHKLGGDAVHHFGGFFDDRWRRADLLWGRLDGAEMLIRTLVPLDEVPEERRADVGALRDQLIKQAQLAILAEEEDTVAILGKISKSGSLDANPSPEAVYEFLRKDFDVETSMEKDDDRKKTKSTLFQRAPEIIGRMLGRGRDVDPYATNGKAASPSRTYRVYGKLADAIVQLGRPNGFVPAVTPWVLGLLALASLVGAFVPVAAPFFDGRSIEAVSWALLATLLGGFGIWLLNRGQLLAGIAALGGWVGLLIWAATFDERPGLAAVIALNGVLALVGALVVLFSSRIERTDPSTKMAGGLLLVGISWGVVAGILDHWSALVVAVCVLSCLVSSVVVLVAFRLDIWFEKLLEPSEQKETPKARWWAALFRWAARRLQAATNRRSP